jgi:probable rRNA maturation factor
VATEVVNRQRRVRVDLERIAQLADRTLAAVGRADAKLTIAFVRDPVIRRLNRDYRGKDRSTDVLSFPFGEEQTGAAAREEGEDGSPAAGGMKSEYLGDVVISTDRAVSQAQEAGFSVEREVSELVIHGVLHLCGYDHESDRGTMNRVELRLRRMLV